MATNQLEKVLDSDKEKEIQLLLSKVKKALLSKILLIKKSSIPQKNYDDNIHTYQLKELEISLIKRLGENSLVEIVIKRNKNFFHIYLESSNILQFSLISEIGNIDFDSNGIYFNEDYNIEDVYKYILSILQEIINSIDLIEI